MGDEGGEEGRDRYAGHIKDFGQQYADSRILRIELARFAFFKLALWLSYGDMSGIREAR